MRKVRRSSSVIFCLLFCFVVSPALAYWANPILLQELNDYDNSYSASRPAISADDSLIFFVRKDSTGQSRVWEAYRNPETGVFENARYLHEVRKEGRSVYGTWISEDNKRLYYCGANTSWTKRQLWMATRNDSTELWQNTRLHSELEIEDLLSTCSLTADEKYIMYVTTPKTEPRQFKTYFATRNSTQDPFSTPQEAHELNAIEAQSPIITPDGLTVYFGIVWNPDKWGQQDIWMGQRNSIDEPFSNFTPLDEINSQGHSVMGWFSPSWDGQKLYYLQRNAEPGTPEWSLEVTGIFVSQWVDPPEVAVEKNLAAAIEAKQAILEDLTATIEMEIETLNILDQLQELTDEESDFFKAIQKTKIQLNKALQDEILAQAKISSSIQEMLKASQEFSPVE